ncbi:hypothetical protein [Echinicola vietnamensis]|uniref:hypothetical protein n=1 Tax=Echinicola vietnamensis TaxID=390884 RepID=UPI00059FA68C|nr:hypothetical protein [Echinicola vietnamensis]
MKRCQPERLPDRQGGLALFIHGEEHKTILPLSDLVTCNIANTQYYINMPQNSKAVTWRPFVVPIVKETYCSALLVYPLEWTLNMLRSGQEKIPRKW